MSTSTDEEEFIRAALDLQDVIPQGVENARTRCPRRWCSTHSTTPTDDAEFVGFE